MKPPKMVGLLNYFDCRTLEPLSLSRHLGFTDDAATGLRRDLGFGPYATVVSLLDRPYSFVPVEGDLRREFQEFGDRLRDAKFLWLHAALELTPGRDGDSAEGTEVQGDRVKRDKTGEVYAVARTVPEHGQVGGLCGYLLLREQG